MGETVFRKIQFGKETTRGTAVAATRMFPGAVTVPADRKPTFPVDTIGSRVGVVRSVVNQILADGIGLSMEHSVFQMLPMLFSIGLKGNITASEVTPGQADYLWDFTPSLVASNAPDAVTLEFGNDTQAYEIEYVMAKRYRISGAAGEDAPVKIDADLFGKQITGTTFTSLTPGTVEPIIANKTKMYLDSTWATLGTTVKAGLLRNWEIEILTGVHPVFDADGTLTMSTHGEGVLDAILTMTVENNALGDALWDDFRAGTARAIRIITEGSQIGSGSNYSLTFDIYGKFEEAVPMGADADGNDLTTLVFRAMNDAQSTQHAFGVKVVTNHNAM